MKGFINLAANNMQSTINIGKQEIPQPLPYPNIFIEEEIDTISLRDTIKNIKSIPGCPISVDQSMDINQQKLIDFYYSKPKLI